MFNSCIEQALSRTCLYHVITVYSYSAHCTMYTVHRTFYNIQYTLLTALQSNIDATDTKRAPLSQVEKIFPVTRIKIYPYFYDPFLPNSSRALRNFKNLCAVPVYTRNGPVTVHVIKLLLVEKIPLYCFQLTFFSLISRNFF